MSLNLCVIPARGGSKRIPRKNIRKFHNEPIIAYSIKVALESNLFDKIVVSTDDLEIAGIAREFGAEVPFLRPIELADDHTSTAAVVNHVISEFGAKREFFEYVCCLHATAPMIQKIDLVAAYENLIKSNFEFCISVTEYESSILRSFAFEEDRSIKMIFPEHFYKRSQDLPRAFHDAAQFYWGKMAAWKPDAFLFGDKTTGFVIPRWRVCDIDEESDWKRAEMLYGLAGQ